MKIQLPDQPYGFEKSLETAIGTVKSCRTGISFLEHFIRLIQTIRTHPMTASWIDGLEKENEQRKEAFNIKAIEALEAEWRFLWKAYPQQESKKALLRIKQFFTKNKEQSSQMPLEHTCFSFTEFKIKFNCNTCSEEFSQFVKQNQHLHVVGDDNAYAEYIQTALELDPVYFWDRLCLLERIYQYSPSQSKVHQAPIQGKWNETKYLLWERATNSSLQLIFRFAQQDLWIKFEGDGFVNEKKEFSWPIDMACKFSRTACESYLDRLLIHIRSILPSTDRENHFIKTLNQVVGKRTKPQQKSDELAKHTGDYWRKCPSASYDEVYAYYYDHCKFQPYSRHEWEKKVRALNLDPRLSHEKVRGFSKKGR